MAQIVSIEEKDLILEQLHSQNKKIVLTGGCFDIIHRGHIVLLTEAKKKGDVLIVLLESDETITNLKGPTRPIHTQEDRAYLLSHIQDIDYIIPLPMITGDKAYDELIFAIKPAIIATTKGDPAKVHKVRQASSVNAEVVDVTDFITNTSTTRLANMLQKDL